MPYIESTDVDRLRILANGLLGNEKKRVFENRISRDKLVAIKKKIQRAEDYIRKIEQLQSDALSLLSKYDDSIDPECSDEFLPEDLWITLKHVAFATGCQIWFMIKKQSTIFVSGRIANMARDEEICFIEDIALSSNGLQKILNYFNGRNLIVNIEPISQKSYKLLIDFRNVDNAEQEKIQQELVEKLPTKFFRVSERFNYGHFGGGVILC